MNMNEKLLEIKMCHSHDSHIWDCEMCAVIALLEELIPDEPCKHSMSATLSTETGKLVCDSCNKHIAPEF